MSKKLPQLTDESIKNLESIYPSLHSLIQKLEPVVSKNILDELEKINNTIKNAFEERWKIEEEYSDKEIEELSQIAKANNFKTVWSISEVQPGDFDKPFSENLVKSIGYKGGVINFPGKGKSISWLEAWKCADKLIKESEDEHHIFIEDFDEIIPNSGLFTIITGS